MNVYLVGCEYAGKTTLAREILKWGEKAMGGIRHFHDHFTIPSSELESEAGEALKNAPPQLKEMFQRYILEYHISPGMLDVSRSPDANLMGHAIEEAVYAPLYYGYGGKNSGAPRRAPEGSRTVVARSMEKKILEYAPSMVLVLMKASPEIIQKRMEAHPETKHGEPTRGVVRKEDIEHVLLRFQEEYEWSLIQNKFILDTTSASVEETFSEFLEKHDPYTTEADRLRIQGH